MEIDGQGFEVLRPARCVELLQGCRLGRLAVVDRAMPLIVPIVFSLCGCDVIMSAGPGTVARAAASGQIVCFQADWSDETTMEAWTVAMIGPLAAVSACGIDPLVLSSIRSVPWTRHATEFARLHPEVVTGRQFMQP